jgi:hypothetical protein
MNSKVRNWAMVWVGLFIFSFIYMVYIANSVPIWMGKDPLMAALVAATLLVVLLLLIRGCGMAFMDTVRSSRGELTPHPPRRRRKSAL